MFCKLPIQLVSGVNLLVSGYIVGYFFEIIVSNGCGIARLSTELQRGVTKGAEGSEGAEVGVSCHPCSPYVSTHGCESGNPEAS